MCFFIVKTHNTTHTQYNQHDIKTTIQIPRFEQNTNFKFNTFLNAIIFKEKHYKKQHENTTQQTTQHQTTTQHN